MSRIPAWAYGAVAGVVLLAGVYLEGKHVENASWTARWAARDAAEKAAADAAIAAHQAELSAAQSRNTEIIHALDDAKKHLADRSAALNLAEQLLHAARAAPRRRPLPEAAAVPGAPAAGGTGGPAPAPELAQLVGDAFGECAANADRLDALIAELKPQL